jgi:hypothetical protein
MEKERKGVEKKERAQECLSTHSASKMVCLENPKIVFFKKISAR